MQMQLSSAALLIGDVVKVFNPQSPQARAIYDLAIVVTAVMVVIFAAIAREDCGTARQLLVSDSSATFVGYFFLDCRAPKKTMKRQLNGSLTR